MKRLKVKPDAQFSYHNSYLHQTTTFTPVNDALVATLHPHDQPKLLKAFRRLDHAATRHLDPDAGLVIYEKLTDQRKTRQMLEAHPNVANVTSVFQDDLGNRRYLLPDEITIQFKDNVDHATAVRLIQTLKSTVIEKHRIAGYYTIAVPENSSLAATLQQFGKLNEVEFVETSEVLFNTLSYTPADPDFGVQYGLNRIQAPAAWDLTRGSANVIVAIIDTGIDLDHPGLVDNILPRGNEDWSFGVGMGKAPKDLQDHGTHCAGIAAAVENAVDIIGVAPRCKILPLRVFGHSRVMRPFGAANAIDYVREQAKTHTNNRYVANLSWGFFASFAAWHRAIRKAVEANVVVVAAAGNTGKELEKRSQYPALYDEVIAVGNTNFFDVLNSQSSYGASLDVCAPGTAILSTIPDDTTDFFSGTSMAAPHVTGAAALLWSFNPNLTHTDVRRILESTCDNIDAQNPNFVGKLGHGRINVFNALRSIALQVFFAGDGTVDIARGQAIDVGILIRKAPGFTNPITLSLLSIPTGINPVLGLPNADQTSANLHLEADATVPFGPRTLTLQATDGNITAAATLTILVKPFTLTVADPALTLVAGDTELHSDEVAITIHRSTGFTETVQLTIEGMPPPSSTQNASVNGTLAPASTFGNSSTLTVSAGRFSPDRDFLLTIRGKSPTGEDTTKVSVEVFASPVESPPIIQSS